jgi:hypothetical protein
MRSCTIFLAGVIVMVTAHIMPVFVLGTILTVIGFLLMCLQEDK